MPYAIRKNGNEYCVHNTDTNDNKGCSPTRAKASAHMRALYAAESGSSYSSADEAISNLKLALELQAGLIDGSIVLSEESEEELSIYLEEALAALEEYENISETETTPDEFEDLGHIELSEHVELSESEEFTAEGMTEYPWEGPIVFENVSTGDNRIFKSNSIIWEPETLPWAFRWQKSSGQGHAGSVPVGRVDRLQRMEDGSIYGYGVVIPALSVEATEYMKLLETGVGGGVSVDGDSAQFDVLENDEGQPRVEFSSMRLRALSAVDIPAFNGARIHLIKPNKYPVIAKDPQQGQPVSQTPASAPASVMGLATSSSSTGTVKISYETTETVEEAVAPELLHTLEEIQDVIDEVVDGEIEVEANTYFRTKESIGWRFDNLVASAIPVLPTIEAFVEPEFTGPTPLTVTKDGRVFGHLALFNTCHIGFPGTCVKPPKGSKYQYFHTGQIETSEGDLVDVGHLTFNTGHAGMSDNPRAAAEHYDNTGTVAADVRAGEDQFGIWVVGALRSHLSDADIRAFRSAPLSGDWRRIAGRLELVGALAVNTPGFMVPRAKALVASGETETLFTFLEDDNEEFISDYEMKLRINKKVALGNKVGVTKVEIITDVVEDLTLEGADPITDYELQLRFDKKLALAQRLGDPESEFAQSLGDFLAEKDGEVPAADNLPDTLQELPKTPTKADITKIAKSYTQSELLHDLQDLRDLLDDPTEKIKATDRKNLEALYALFISTDKTGAKFTGSGENLEEFYNKCHGKGGKFCGTGGRSGGGKGVSGKANPGGPYSGHRPGGGYAGPKGGYSGAPPAGGRPGGGFKSSGGKPGGGGGKPGGGKPGGGFDRSAGDREQAVKQLSGYRTSKISARRWATTSAIATAAQLAIRGGLPLIKLVGPISPLLASPAVLAGLGGLGIFHAGKQLLAAKNHKRDFSSTIDRINKRQKIDEQIRRLNSTKP